MLLDLNFTKTMLIAFAALIAQFVFTGVYEYCADVDGAAKTKFNG